VRKTRAQWMRSQGKNTERQPRRISPTSLVITVCLVVWHVSDLSADEELYSHHLLYDGWVMGQMFDAVHIHAWTMRVHAYACVRLCTYVCACACPLVHMCAYLQIYLPAASHDRYARVH